MKIAYLDTFAGISGDMTVGALLQLGLPLAALRDAASALALDGVELGAEALSRSGITAVKFHVRVHGIVPDAPAADADHEHHHGAHHHAPAQPHAHPHAHRAYREIRALIAGSALPARVKALALDVFARLADAEGHVHGIPADDV